MEVGGMLWSNWRKLAKGNEMEKKIIKKSRLRMKFVPNLKIIIKNDFFCTK